MTLVIVVIFLSMGFQALNEYLRLIYPTSSPSYYLYFAVGALGIAIVFAIYAGLSILRESD